MQLVPMDLDGGADLYNSHSAASGYRTSVTAIDTPTVRKSSPPFVPTPGQAIDQGVNKMIVKNTNKPSVATLNHFFLKKKREREKKVNYLIFSYFTHRCVGDDTHRATLKTENLLWIGTRGDQHVGKR